MAEQERTQREYQAEQMRKLAEGERDKLKIEADGRAGAIEREAKAQATAAVVKAEADAKALELISKALEANPRLVIYRYIEKLAPGIKVMLVPNDNPFLLPLPDMMTEAGGELQSTLQPTTTQTIPGELAPITTQTATPSPTPTPTLVR